MTTIRWSRLAPAVTGLALAAALGACSEGGDDEQVGADPTTSTIADEGSPTTGGDEGASTTTVVTGEGEPGSVTAPDHPGEHPHWGYDAEDGPDHWADLDAEHWSRCRTGEQQSPIDLPADAPSGEAPDLVVDYDAGPLAMRSNGHTVEARTAEATSSISLDDVTYPFAALHFHAHSEHTVDGREWPLEVHFVNKLGEGAAARIAVLGVLVEEGEHNDAFAAVLDHMPATKGTTDSPFTPVDGVEVDLDALLPEDRSFFHYTGSLTTPDCSEGVSWQVLTTPIEMSAEQVAAFATPYADSFRPSQDRHERPVVLAGG